MFIAHTNFKSPLTWYNFCDDAVYLIHSFRIPIGYNRYQEKFELQKRCWMVGLRSTVLVEIDWSHNMVFMMGVLAWAMLPHGRASSKLNLPIEPTIHHGALLYYTRDLDHYCFIWHILVCFDSKWLSEPIITYELHELRNEFPYNYIWNPNISLLRMDLKVSVGAGNM